MFMFFFFFNDTATTEIYTLSLHDALPISLRAGVSTARSGAATTAGVAAGEPAAATAPATTTVAPRAAKRRADRKSTRLNSSHANISYAVFCLKKKKKIIKRYTKV